MGRGTTTVLAVCLLAAVGCGKDAAPRAEPSAPASSTATTPSEPASTSASPTPVTFTYGAPFFADDFHTDAKGWPERDTDTATYVVHADYATPLYAMTAKKPKYQLFPKPDLTAVADRLTDYQVRATLQTTLSMGHEEWFGVTCRDAGGTRYSFQVANQYGDDLSWLIAKQDASGEHVLGRGDAKVGGSAFDVGGTCAGGADGGPVTLVLTVNDAEIGRATDSDSPLVTGFAGVYLYTKNGKATMNVLGFAIRPATAA